MLQVRTLQASDKTNKIQRIQKIRQLSVDTSDLSPEEGNSLFVKPTNYFLFYF